MNNLKPIHLLAAMGWVSLFALISLMLFGVSGLSPFAGIAVLFFAVVAIVASALASQNK